MSYVIFNDPTGQELALEEKNIDAYINSQIENGNITSDQAPGLSQQLLNLPKFSKSEKGYTPVIDVQKTRQMVKGTSVSPQDYEKDLRGEPPGSGISMEKSDKSFWQKAGERVFLTDIEVTQPFERIGYQIGLPILAAEYIDRSKKIAKLDPRVKAAMMIGGPIAASMAGSVGPEIRYEVQELIGLSPEGTRKQRALSNAEISRVLESEAYLMGIFDTALFAARMGGRKLTEKMAGVTDESKRLAKIAKETYDIDLLPSQVGKGTFANTVINVLGRMPYIGGGARARTFESQRQLYEAQANLPYRIAPLLSSSNLSLKVYEEYKTLWDSFSEAKNAAYNRIFDEAKNLNVKVEPINANATVESIRKEISKRRPKKLVKKQPKDQSVADVAPEITDDVLQPTNVDDVLSGTEDGVAATTEEFKKVKTSPAESDRLVASFLKREFKNLDVQTLENMDVAIQKIDEFIGEAYKTKGEKIGKGVYAQLSEVKRALKTDIVENLIGDSDAVRQVADDLAKQDAEFTKQLTELFETATAKRFEQFKGGGIKASTLASESATQRNIDTLLGIIVDLDSPMAIKEFAKIIPKETLNQVAVRFLSDALDKSFELKADGTYGINPEKLSQFLGVRPSKLGDTSRADAITQLFKESAVPVYSIRSLSNIVDAVMKGKVPDLSTYLARRGTLGGPSSLAKLLTAGAVTFGGTASGTLLWTLAGFYGARQFLNMLTDPLNARFLSDVLSEEVSRTGKRSAYLQLVRGALNLGVQSGKSGVENVQESVEAIQEQLEPVEGRSLIEKASDVVREANTQTTRFTKAEMARAYNGAKTLFNEIIPKE